MVRVKTAVQILRAPFFTAVVIPALVGAALAWQEGSFQGGYLVLTVIGIVCINAGLNLSNDYFDHLSGNDANNKDLTPFSGGSRTIQNGVLAARQVILASIVFYLLGIAIGLYLMFTRGWTLLWIGALGVFIALFHNAPPFKLYYLAPGVGELATGIGCGPLIVLGSYFVQTQHLSYKALWASIPIGLLTAAVLYINEFPDHDADKSVGKKTLVVVLGKERAVWVYVAILIATYVSIIAGVVLGFFPYTMLITLVSALMAYKGIQGVRRFHSDTQQLIPTNAITIQTNLVTGLLMCVAYIVARLLN